MTAGDPVDGESTLEDIEARCALIPPAALIPPTPVVPVAGGFAPSEPPSLP